MSEQTMISLRVSRARLAAIDARARSAGLSRNAYMVRAALGELDDPSALRREMDDLLDRIERLERSQFG